MAGNQMEEDLPRFYTDVEWYERNDRSFTAFAQTRMCKSCQSKIGAETQERVPTFDNKTGQVIYELHTVKYGQNPMQSIRNCCSKERDYITIETPTAEVIFRAFLASNNQPSDVETIRDMLSTYIPLSERPHGYDASVIERILRNDEYYGFSEFGRLEELTQSG